MLQAQLPQTTGGVAEPAIAQELRRRFPDVSFTPQTANDGLPTLWVGTEDLKAVLRYLKLEAAQPFTMLYDLTAIDERERRHRPGQPPGDFTVLYQLSSLDRNEDVRLKVSLTAERPSVPTISDLWRSADWYEREVWDMFGLRVEGHPRLRRLLMPQWWEGHPLRKEHPARATEMEPFALTPEREEALMADLEFRPEDHGMARQHQDLDLMFLNFGPHHPGTHGVLRVVLQLDGQEIVGAVCDIGFHHRGVEKMAERQSWHTFIPYTDRVDYLAGVLNNQPYVQAVEGLAGIEVPDRARLIRIMTAELFRIISHLVFYGTLAQDVGMMSPVFYMFADRERALDIIEAITGARMHPSWFRIGGVAQDLPEGWEGMVRDFVGYMTRKLREYDRTVLSNAIFRARTRGVGDIPAAEAIEWGATGPMLRGCGVAWDLRKARPYGGYEQLEFEVPVGSRGDCYDRVQVHVEEIRQSLRLISQCVDQMPAGPYKADHPLTVPPPRDAMLHDIETLIAHFLAVSWGPVIPPGEHCNRTESAKGQTSYYLISDGNTAPYRARIRTPSFAHVQMLPRLCQGLMIPDLVAILGSVDFVLADVDR